MPGTVKKVDGYQGTWGGKVTAKNTSKKKAVSQQNLLRGIEHGWKPTGKPARKKRRKRSRKTLLT